MAASFPDSPHRLSGTFYLQFSFLLKCKVCAPFPGGAEQKLVRISSWDLILSTVLLKVHSDPGSAPFPTASNRGFSPRPPHSSPVHCPFLLSFSEATVRLIGCSRWAASRIPPPWAQCLRCWWYSIPLWGHWFVLFINIAMNYPLRFQFNRLIFITLANRWELL